MVSNVILLGGLRVNVNRGGLPTFATGLPTEPVGSNGALKDFSVCSDLLLPGHFALGGEQGGAGRGASVKSDLSSWHRSVAVRVSDIADKLGEGHPLLLLGGGLCDWGELVSSQGVGARCRSPDAGGSLARSAGTDTRLGWSCA